MSLLSLRVLNFRFVFSSRSTLTTIVSLGFSSSTGSDCTKHQFILLSSSKPYTVSLDTTRNVLVKDILTFSLGPILTQPSYLLIVLHNRKNLFEVLILLFPPQRLLLCPIILTTESNPYISPVTHPIPLSRFPL